MATTTKRKRDYAAERRRTEINRAKRKLAEINEAVVSDDEDLDERLRELEELTREPEPEPAPVVPPPRLYLNDYVFPHSLDKLTRTEIDSWVAVVDQATAILLSCRCEPTSLYREYCDYVADPEDDDDPLTYGTGRSPCFLGPFTGYVEMLRDSGRTRFPLERLEALGVPLSYRPGSLELIYLWDFVLPHWFVAVGLCRLLQPATQAELEFLMQARWQAFADDPNDAPSWTAAELAELTARYAADLVERLPPQMVADGADYHLAAAPAVWEPPPPARPVKRRRPVVVPD